MANQRQKQDDLHPLETLERRFGCAVADKLEDAFAGCELYVPKGPIVDDHPIVKAIGRDAADMLIEECGGVRFHMPIELSRQRRVADMRQDGRTIPEIALALNMSVRGVSRALRKARSTNGGGPDCKEHI